MQFTNIHFGSLIIFLGLVLFFVFLWYLFYKKREKLKQKYVLLFNQNKYFYLKYIFLFLSFFIILFSIFWVRYWEKSSKNIINWIDTVFLLDVSKSMNALDFSDSKYKVSRLDFSKKLISDYVSKNNTNRYWLVIFAWDAISSVPLTTDTSAFLTFLKNVDYRNLNKQWTNFEKAVELWVDRLQIDNKNNRAKSLIVVSDWWDDWDNIDFDYISKLVKDKKITSFVLWVWKTSWAKIPLWQDSFWRISYQKYKWQDVITKLNKSSLKNLSNSLDWEYITANSISDLDSLESNLNNLEKKAIEVKWATIKKDFSRFLAMLSLLFFILYLFYNPRK